MCACPSPLCVCVLHVYVLLGSCVREYAWVGKMCMRGNSCVPKARAEENWAGLWHVQVKVGVQLLRRRSFLEEDTVQSLPKLTHRDRNKGHLLRERKHSSFQSKRYRRERQEGERRMEKGKGGWRKVRRMKGAESMWRKDAEETAAAV